MVMSDDDSDHERGDQDDEDDDEVCHHPPVRHHAACSDTPHAEIDPERNAEVFTLNMLRGFLALICF